MNFIGLLRTLEQITRPPRMGHDDDRPLPDYEPVSPDGYYGYAEPNLGVYDADEANAAIKRQMVADGLIPDDTPNPAEPGLTPDELVGVRGILQERYEDPVLKAADEDVIADLNQALADFGKVDLASTVRNEIVGTLAIAAISDVTGELRTQEPLHSDPWVKGYHAALFDVENRVNQAIEDFRAGNHTGTGAEPAPSPTIVQSAPPPTVDGEGPSEVSGHSPVPPSEGRPTSELLTEAARIIGNLSQYTVEYFYRDLMHELCERAATFKAIEE